MKNQAGRLREAVEAKRRELVELFKGMGHEVLPCGRKVESLTLTELQDRYKQGIKK